MQGDAGAFSGEFEVLRGKALDKENTQLKDAQRRTRR